MGLYRLPEVIEILQTSDTELEARLRIAKMEAEDSARLWTLIVVLGAILLLVLWIFA
jgi:hypothetical protein